MFLGLGIEKNAKNGGFGTFLKINILEKEFKESSSVIAEIYYKEWQIKAWKEPNPSILKSTLLGLFLPFSEF